MSEFFQPSEALQRFFAENGEIIVYKKGVPFVSGADDVPWMYLLSDGLVKVIISPDDGQESTLGFFVRGMGFAQLGAVFGARSTALTYETVTPCTLYRIPLNTFFTQLESSLELTTEWLHQAQRNQSFLVERIAFLSEKGVQGKLIKWLQFMVKYYGITKDDTSEIPIALTHDGIADFLNTTRESINKNMRKLIDQGLVSVTRKRITVNSLVELNKL